jgi:hypothetical protein
MRRGSKKDHGQATITLDSPKVMWDDDHDHVVMRSYNVQDFNNTNSHHNYAVKIDVPDLVKVLASLAKSDVALHDAAADLLKLAYLAAQPDDSL